jgi:hypothetical protein
MRILYASQQDRLTQSLETPFSVVIADLAIIEIGHRVVII